MSWIWQDDVPHGACRYLVGMAGQGGGERLPGPGSWLAWKAPCALPLYLPPQIKRLGRGIGSGHGKTSGKGHKGQNSRSGKVSSRTAGLRVRDEHAGG